jgi:hypothetical protein
MVSEFGFLKSTTNGLPDLVLWSHDSAQRSPGALWKFDGSAYEPDCGWEIVRLFRELPDHRWVDAEEHVESNTCNSFDEQGRKKQNKPK